VPVEVKSVALALAPSRGPVGPVGLDDGLAVGAKPACEPGAVAETGPSVLAQRARPSQQRGVARGLVGGCAGAIELGISMPVFAGAAPAVGRSVSAGQVVRSRSKNRR
jgi:hypothetical protein